MRVEKIGGATLYLGDCREILPTLPRADAVITDPPYEIGDGGWGGAWGNASGAKSRLWTRQEWDVKPDSTMLQIITAGPAIVWGGNYFELPPTKGWLIWDKGADSTQAQAELAWSNIAVNARVFRQTTLGAFGNGGANGEVKEHPTQKPLPLMLWCMGIAAKARTIADPYMGSGSTGVAALQTSREFVGIEREPRYFEIACRRIEQAHNQRPLFAAEQHPVAQQLGLEGT